MKNENASGNVNMSNLLANLNVVLTYLTKKSGDKNNKNAVSKDGTAGYDHNAMGAPSSRITDSSSSWYDVMEGHSSYLTVARPMMPPPYIVGAMYVIIAANMINVVTTKMVLFAVSMKNLARLAYIRSQANPSNLTNGHIDVEEKKEKKKEDANLLDSLDLRSVVKNLKENEKIAKIASLIIQWIKENGGHMPEDGDDKNNKNAVFRGNNYVRENSNDKNTVFKDYNVTGAPSSGIRGAISSGIREAPSSRIREAPSPGITKAPSPGITKAPSPGITKAPSPGITKAPSYRVTLSSSPGITGAPSSRITLSSSPGITGAHSPRITLSYSPGINVDEVAPYFTSPIPRDTRSQIVPILLRGLISSKGPLGSMSLDVYAENPTNVTGAHSSRITLSSLPWTTRTHSSWTTRAHSSEITELPPFIVLTAYVVATDVINFITTEVVQLTVSVGILAYLETICNRANLSNLINDHIAGEEKKEDANLLHQANSANLTNDHIAGEKKKGEKEEGANLLNRLDLSSVENIEENENVETLTQFASHENSSDDEQTIKVK